MKCVQCLLCSVAESKDVEVRVNFYTVYKFPSLNHSLFSIAWIMRTIEKLLNARQVSFLWVHWVSAKITTTYKLGWRQKYTKKIWIHWCQFTLLFVIIMNKMVKWGHSIEILCFALWVRMPVHKMKKCWHLTFKNIIERHCQIIKYQRPVWQ